MSSEIKSISGSQFPKEVIPLINSAKNTINIIVFDWRWYSNDPGATCQLFNQAVLAAARRGVKIRVITSNDKIIEILKKGGIDAKKLNISKLVHAKLMIIDENIVVTGSHNYTISAFTQNLEFSLIITDPLPQSETLSFFNNIWPS